MARMVRKQVYIELRQDEMLKRRAQELGVPESELIRRGIDQVVRAPLTLYTGQEDWEAEKEYIREHRCPEVPQTGRGWTREDLYEERLRRYPG